MIAYFLGCLNTSCQQFTKIQRAELPAIKRWPVFPMAATRELNYTGYAVLRIKAGSNGKLVLARATKQEISSGAKKKK